LGAQAALGDGAVVGGEHDADGLALGGGTRGRSPGGGSRKQPRQEWVLLAYRLVAHDGDFAVAWRGHEGDDAAALEKAQDALRVPLPP
jgi:hypothetical protein